MCGVEIRRMGVPSRSVFDGRQVIEVVRNQQYWLASRERDLDGYKSNPEPLGPHRPMTRWKGRSLKTPFYQSPNPQFDFSFDDVPAHTINVVCVCLCVCGSPGAEIAALNLKVCCESTEPDRTQPNRTEPQGDPHRSTDPDPQLTIVSRLTAGQGPNVNALRNWLQLK